MIALTVLVVGLLVFLAHLFSALFDRTRVPDVLPLVLLGLLIGPLAGLVTPDAFGKVGSVFTTLALVVILFESGLGLNLKTLTQSLLPGTILTVASFVATVAVTAGLMAPILGLSWLEGMTLGSILGGTSSAVVIPMIGKLALAERTRAVLMLESTFSDVLCIVVTLGFLEAFRSADLRPGLMLGQILASFLLAAVIGFAGAVFWSMVLERVRQIENTVFTTPALVFILFGVAELLGYSGAIAALAFGVTLGNLESFDQSWLRHLRARPVRLRDVEKSLYAEAVFLIKTFFFVYIGLSIRLADLGLVAAGLLLTAVLFVLRIPVVRGSMDASTPRFDASVAAVMVPKGLAAAVLASLPLQEGLAGGAMIQDVTYAVILFTIAATAGLCFLIERGGLSRLYARFLEPFADSPAKS